MRNKFFNILAAYFLCIAIFFPLHISVIWFTSSEAERVSPQYKTDHGFGNFNKKKKNKKKWYLPYFCM